MLECKGPFFAENTGNKLYLNLELYIEFQIIDNKIIIFPQDNVRKI